MKYSHKHQTNFLRFGKNPCLLTIFVPDHIQQGDRRDRLAVAHQNFFKFSIKRIAARVEESGLRTEVLRQELWLKLTFDFYYSGKYAVFPRSNLNIDLNDNTDNEVDLNITSERGEYLRHSLAQRSAGCAFRNTPEPAGVCPWLSESSPTQAFHQEMGRGQPE